MKLAGAKFEKTSTPQSASTPVSDKKIMFKDPAEYKNMSEDERIKATQEMMGRHRSMRILGVKADV